MPCLHRSTRTQVIRLSFVLPPPGEGAVLPRLLTLACLLIDLVGSYRLSPGEQGGGPGLSTFNLLHEPCGLLAVVKALGCVRMPSPGPHPHTPERRAAEAGDRCAVQAGGGGPRQRAGKQADPGPCVPVGQRGATACMLPFGRYAAKRPARPSRPVQLPPLVRTVAKELLQLRRGAASRCVQDEMRKRAEERRLAKLQEEQVRVGPSCNSSQLVRTPSRKGLGQLRAAQLRENLLAITFLRVLLTPAGP